MTPPRQVEAPAHMVHAAASRLRAIEALVAIEELLRTQEEQGEGVPLPMVVETSEDAIRHAQRIIIASQQILQIVRGG